MNFSAINEFIPLLFLAGMAGGLIADIVQDNCINLPTKLGHVLNLGSLGGLLIGGIAGVIIDGSYLTAFMGGFMGKEIIVRLVANVEHMRRLEVAGFEPDSD